MSRGGTRVAGTLGSALEISYMPSSTTHRLNSVYCRLTEQPATRVSRETCNNTTARAARREIYTLDLDTNCVLRTRDPHIENLGDGGLHASLSFKLLLLPPYRPSWLSSSRRLLFESCARCSRSLRKKESLRSGVRGDPDCARMPMGRGLGNVGSGGNVTGGGDGDWLRSGGCVSSRMSIISRPSESRVGISTDGDECCRTTAGSGDDRPGLPPLPNDQTIKVWDAGTLARPSLA